MKKNIFIFAIFLSLGFLSAQAQTATFQKEAIQCLGVEGDGSQTVRVTGSGRNRTDAIEQAKKDAVYAVIFEGIRVNAATGGCNTKPLIYEHNAREKYEEYFDIFFADGGEYSKYATLEDKKIRSNSKSKNKYFKNYRIIVRVLRPELKARLKSDHIIK